MAVRGLCADGSWQRGFGHAEPSLDQEYAWLRSDDELMFWSGQADASHAGGRSTLFDLGIAGEGIAIIDDSSQPDSHQGSHWSGAARCEDFPTNFPAEENAQPNPAGDDLGRRADVILDGSFESSSSRNDLLLV